MNPLIDQLAVAALICAALVFFVMRYLRRRRAAKQGCVSDCGCGPADKKG